MRLADGQSLLQKAFLRGAALPGVQEIMVVTNLELFFKTADEFREVNRTGLATSFVLEPCGRNTAAAVAMAALRASEAFGPDTHLLVLAADHLVADQAAFQAAVGKALELSAAGRLVTFGIPPESPETGYGYIQADGSTVLRFIEKPTADKAREYMHSGRYFWNSGMFCFTVATLLAQMGEHCPEILGAARLCFDKSRKAEGAGYAQLELDAASFMSIPDDSIDYALMEKSDRVAVVPCTIGWKDIGSWKALGALNEPDARGNRVRGEAVLCEASNCYIHGGDRLVAAVGVEDLVIVDTPDALLVAHKNSSQNVKQVYSELKARGHDAYKVPRTVHRPWGTYTVLQESEDCKIKRIEVKPGASLSLQMHRHRSEHWVVVSGMAKVVNGEQEIFVNANESTYIPAGHKHRLENPGTLSLVVIEVQSGPYLGEDDIVRFQDAYART